MLLSLPKKYCFILLISYTYDFELANLIIVNACMIQYRGRGGEKKKIKYRDPLFKPTWWLEEEWSWEAAVNFKEKKYYTGPGTLTEFLKRSIRLCLEGMINLCFELLNFKNVVTKYSRVHKNAMIWDPLLRGRVIL